MGQSKKEGNRSEKIIPQSNEGGTIQVILSLGNKGNIIHKTGLTWNRRIVLGQRSGGSCHFDFCKKQNSEGKVSRFFG